MCVGIKTRRYGVKINNPFAFHPAVLYITYDTFVKRPIEQYIYPLWWGCFIQTTCLTVEKRIIIKINKGFIGKNVKILIKLEVSECRGVVNLCRLKTQKTFVSKSNSAPEIVSQIEGSVQGADCNRAKSSNVSVRGQRWWTD
jgi:hypothetical protein